MSPQFITIEDAVESNKAVVRWLKSLPANKPLTMRNSATFEDEIVIPNPHIAAEILIMTSQTEGHA